MAFRLQGHSLPGNGVGKDLLSYPEKPDSAYMYLIHILSTAQLRCRYHTENYPLMPVLYKRSLSFPQTEQLNGFIMSYWDGSWLPLRYLWISIELPLNSTFQCTLDQNFLHFLSRQQHCNNHQLRHHHGGGGFTYNYGGRTLNYRRDFGWVRTENVFLSRDEFQGISNDMYDELFGIALCLLLCCLVYNVGQL